MKEWLLQHLLELGFGIATTFMGVVIKKMAKKVREQETVKLGVQALLRDSIIKQYTHYMEKGFCPIYARENIDHLYQEYHNLGGNGIIDGLVEKVMALPTDKED